MSLARERRAMERRTPGSVSRQELENFETKCAAHERQIEAAKSKLQELHSKREALEAEERSLSEQILAT